MKITKHTTTHSLPRLLPKMRRRIFLLPYFFFSNRCCCCYYVVFFLLFSLSHFPLPIVYNTTQQNNKQNRNFLCIVATFGISDTTKKEKKYFLCVRRKNAHTKVKRKVAECWAPPQYYCAASHVRSGEF